MKNAQNTNTINTIDLSKISAAELRALAKTKREQEKEVEKKARIEAAQNSIAVYDDEKGWVAVDTRTVSVPNNAITASLKKGADGKYSAEFTNLPKKVKAFRGSQVGFFYWVFNKGLKAQGYKLDQASFTYEK